MNRPTITYTERLDIEHNSFGAARWLQASNTRLDAHEARIAGLEERMAALARRPAGLSYAGTWDVGTEYRRDRHSYTTNTD